MSEDFGHEVVQTPVPGFPGLTQREHMFADAYVEVSLLHGEQRAPLLAYRRAFPLSTASNVIAARLASQFLASPRVQDLIRYLRRELSSKSKVPSERVIDEVERIAFSSVLDYIAVREGGEVEVDLSRVDSRVASAISEVSIKEVRKEVVGHDGEVASVIVTRSTRLKLHDKIKALKNLIDLHKLTLELSPDDVERMLREVDAKIKQITMEARVAEGKEE